MEDFGFEISDALEKSGAFLLGPKIMPLFGSRDFGQLVRVCRNGNWRHPGDSENPSQSSLDTFPKTNRQAGFSRGFILFVRKSAHKASAKRQPPVVYHPGYHRYRRGYHRGFPFCQKSSISRRRA
jgi:hypothetical protein